MEVAVADVLTMHVHDAPRVVMGTFDVHGHPVPAELQVAHAAPLTEMPRGLCEVRVRLEPEPASVPDRARGARVRPRAAAAIAGAAVGGKRPDGADIDLAQHPGAIADGGLRP